MNWPHPAHDQDDWKNISELVYADDTLVVSCTGEHAQSYMNSISAAGANYGLSFNWQKLEMLTVRCQAQVSKPDGSMVESKDHLVYLGGMLSANGQPGPELDRRLGAARGDFHTLQRM